MVGVPGRSKGCSTCRKRKKGCDRKRPTCTQCFAAGLECGGYEREAVFLNHNQDTKAKSIAVIYRKKLVDTAHAPPGGDVDIVLPHQLAQTAYIERYISMFLSDYLPSSCSASSHDWMAIAHGLHTSEKAVQLSLLSFGLFAAGKPESALCSYSGALRKLQAALCHQGRTQNDSILATCQLLSLFEIFHGADVNLLSQGLKWHSHLTGQIAIIKSRSPYEYQHGASHQLFAEARYALIFSAAKARQRFPLNTHEWLTIPWEHEPKTPSDKLYDLFADLAEIIADTDQMWCCVDPVKKASLKSSIVRACWNLDKGLKTWLDETGPLKDFPRVDVDDEGVGPTDPQDFTLAHSTLLYWTIYIILFMTVASILDPTLSHVPQNLDPRPFLRNIANALPYFWGPGAGLKGASMAAMPWGMSLHITYMALHLYDEERVLLERYVFMPRFVTAMRFLHSLHRSTATPELATVEGTEGMVRRARSWLLGGGNDEFLRLVSSLDDIPV